MSEADALDPSLLRRAFGAFATGVAVIGTHAADGTPVGMTVNSFASVSLSPPLVSFCPAKTSMAFPVYSVMTHFSVNVLGEEQRAVSDRFARSVQGNKWVGVPYHLGEHAVPVIEDALASFECVVENRVEAGDHTIVIGRVLRIHGPRDKKPLIFHASRYGSLSPEEVPGPEEILGWES
jgi:flavin reductase (DIM6/NTAB) family NADH-FMN oxidoreductase RutF